MLLLKGYQKRHLRGLGHRLKPSIIIGKRGLTEMVYLAIEQALLHNELVKIRFLELKTKEIKQELISSIKRNNGCCLVGTVGHTALFYRPNPQIGKKHIALPRR